MFNPKRQQWQRQTSFRPFIRLHESENVFDEHLTMVLITTVEWHPTIGDWRDV